MKHQDKINWMVQWAHKNRVVLSLEAECGFGRECVGILALTDAYPDYEWYDDNHIHRLDQNGDVWKPIDAYHKHPCVAVLGRGENAEAQLYDWLKWFDDNGFVVKTGTIGKKKFTDIEIIFCKHQYARMVKGGG